MRTVAAALVVLTAIAGPALSANPLDNDAATGGDAGDASVVATPIDRGVHAGRLVQGVDRADWYSFGVTGGSFVRFGLESGFWYVMASVQDSAGNPVTFTWGDFGQQRVYVPHDDTWFVQVAIPVLASSPDGTRVPTLTPYALTVLDDAPPYVMVLEPGLEWGAIEVRWNEPANITSVGRIETPGTIDSEPWGCLVAKEGEIVTPSYAFRFQGAMRVWHTGTSHTLRVEPSPLEEQHIPVPSFTVGRGFGMSSLAPSDATGFLRLTSYCTSGNPVDRLLFASDRPFEVSTAVGNGSVSWNEYNAGTETQLLAPAASLTPARDMRLNLDDTFTGILQAREGTEIYAVDPAGRRYEPSGFGNDVFFADPAPGEWTLHVGETLGVAHGTVQNYFEGAWIPYLGVTDPVRFPMR